MFAQEYEYSASGSLGPIPTLIMFVAFIFVIASMWKTFVKAGQPGWAVLVPIYNLVVMLKIVGKPTWWVLLMLIPFVNFVVAIIVTIALAKSFGKGTGFGLGLLFLGFIFYPILGFGDAQYQGPVDGAITPAAAAV